MKCELYYSRFEVSPFKVSPFEISPFKFNPFDIPQIEFGPFEVNLFKDNIFCSFKRFRLAAFEANTEETYFLRFAAAWRLGIRN